MKEMKGFAKLLSVAALGIGLAGAPAYALDLTPSTTGVFGQNLGPANCEPGCVYNAFGLPNDGSLTLLYKDNVGGSEEGSFAGSYSTAFLATPTDPSGATISFTGGPSIGCPACYLAIKDGNQRPSYYFYNLASWNGTETINLSGFWPARGAISHVSIWGIPSTSVPEPASLLLLGAGLAGMGIWRRKFGNA